jgi:hypothetical protein
MSSRQIQLTNLPEELILQIASFLNGLDLLSLTHVNRFLYAVVSGSGILWKKVMAREGLSRSQIIGNL